MNFPKRHDLACYGGEFQFEGSGFCPQQWEISVPQKPCITWSVILSYLKRSDLAIPGQFENRLIQLTGGMLLDLELAKAAIQDFNPFFNIHKCFFDETLQGICKKFRKLLDEKRAPKDRKAWTDLKIISSMLNVKILIVDLNANELNVIEPQGNSIADVECITLISKEHTTEINGKKIDLKRFNFGLDEDLCCELRKKALGIILETSEIKTKADEEILPLLDRGVKDINFVTTLLKKDFGSSVCCLYESWYVARKLSDAGFETDPRVLDKHGFSAFYYAMQSNDRNLICILYKYAANNCYETEKTIRDPDPSIISNFSKLNEILNGDCARSNNFEELGDGAESARVTHQDLLRLNAFLTQVSRGIIDIKQKPEGSCLEVAVKQKERILLILDAYDAFFSVGQLDSQQVSEEELIENYTKHKAYYDYLDLTVALLFFDNIFLLKSVLESPREGLYSELESSFLLSAIANRYFTDDPRNGTKTEDLGLDSDSNQLLIIPLLERLNLREKVKHFCSILREKQELVEDDTVPCIPKKEIDKTLSNFLTLKDEFLIYRLDHYMKTALETAPDSVKQRIVVQRALQVIGESINVEKDDSSSIRDLLRKCLPCDTLEILRKTRHTLSHLKCFQFPLKFETEEENALFTCIQSEIRNIKKAFKKVFHIQKIRLKEFLINRGLESVQKFQEDTGFDMQTLVQSMENWGHEFRQKISELEAALDQTGANGNRVIVPCISKFARKVMGYASKEEEDKINGEVPPEIKRRVAVIQELDRDFDRLDARDEDKFNNLFMKKKDINKIKKEFKEYLKEKSKAESSGSPNREGNSGAEPCGSSNVGTEFEVKSSKRCKKSCLLYKIRNSSNPLNTLELILSRMKVSASQLKVLDEEVIKVFSDETKSIYNEIISRGSQGDNLENLLNRIKHLYHISIDEQYDIRFLWERVKSSKARQYLVYKIAQRYFREPSFQASLEMLFFDCVDILKNNEDFRYFWKKDSHLFNGIDVRNVLAHGDPLVESIGDILDPKDLPSELVKKMLQLFEDRECIEALCNLGKRAKETDKIPDREWYKLGERIVRCPRWENYSKLLAEKPKDITNAVVSFLKSVPVPKAKKRTNCNSESSGY